MTDQEYQQLIPKWCELRTVEDHKRFLALCWGVLESKTEDEQYCKPCEFYSEFLSDTIVRDRY